MTVASLQHQDRPVEAVMITGHTQQECVDQIQIRLVLN
jgi:hypothetical protein